MQKLARFSILALVYVIMFILCYSIIPALCWIFGGEFLPVAQHPVHVLFVGVTTLLMLGVLFNECFDSNFYAKKD